MPNISFLHKELLIMVTIESVSSLHVVMNMLYDFFRAERKKYHSRREKARKDTEKYMAIL